MKTILGQYIIGIGLALLIRPIGEIILILLPDIGWHFLTFYYIMIFLSMVLFYHLTAKQNLRWILVSFLTNFILWIAELVVLVKAFGDTIFYQRGIYEIILLMLGGFLWTTNKILIDNIFKGTKKIQFYPSKIDLKLRKYN